MSLFSCFRHLRTEHCTVEGGSFVCRYGYNSVCNSLPVEGVSDLDYADHIMKHHAFSAAHSGKYILYLQVQYTLVKYKLRH